jgi:hypothetical protein
MIKTAGIIGRVNYDDRSFFLEEKLTENGITKIRNLRCQIPKEFFCPISSGDYLCAIFEQIGLLCVAKSQPLVLIPSDKDTFVLQCSEGRQGFRRDRAYAIFEIFRGEIVKMNPARDLKCRPVTDSEVTSLMSSMADEYKRNRRHIDEKFVDLLGSQEATKLCQWFIKRRNYRQLYLFGLNNREINKAKMTYFELLDRCVKRPLTLFHIDLAKCEKLSRQLSIAFTSEQYEMAVIARECFDAVKRRAWTVMPTRILLKTHPKLPQYYSQLESEYGIKHEFDCLYLPEQYNAETLVAKYITDNVESRVSTNAASIDNSKDNKSSPTAVLTSTAPIGKCVSTLISFSQVESVDYKTLLPFQLSADQIDACKQALLKPFCVLDGRAGTGKTTLIRAICAIYQKFNIKFSLCAFTAMAAVRISEATGLGASTIHRTISILKNIAPENLPKVVIIDEASMLETGLLARLISLIPQVEIKLIGDENQLPTIGWGPVMSNVLRVAAVPSVRLLQNHRFYDVPDEKNGVAINANKIIDHPATSPLYFEPTKNCSFIRGDTSLIKTIIEAYHKQGITRDQFVIITPKNKDVDEINKIVQLIYYNDVKSIVDIRGVRWSVGDYIMALDNNYKLGILNGEEGRVLDVNPDYLVTKFTSGEHKIALPQRDLELQPTPSGTRVASPSPAAFARVAGGKPRILNYEKSGDSDDPDGDAPDHVAYEDIRHSYCLTIHKVQGSQRNFVIFYCPTPARNSNFVNKTMIYTAFTRARRALMVIGDPLYVSSQAQVHPAFRHDKLTDRLNKMLPPTQEQIAEMLKRIPGNTSTAPENADDAPYDFDDDL